MNIWWIVTYVLAIFLKINSTQKLWYLQQYTTVAPGQYCWRLGKYMKEWMCSQGKGLEAVLMLIMLWWCHFPKVCIILALSPCIILLHSFLVADKPAANWTHFFHHWARKGSRAQLPLTQERIRLKSRWWNRGRGSALPGPVLILWVAGRSEISMYCSIFVVLFFVFADDAISESIIYLSKMRFHSSSGGSFFFSWCFPFSIDRFVMKFVQFWFLLNFFNWFLFFVYHDPSFELNYRWFWVWCFIEYGVSLHFFDLYDYSFYHFKKLRSCVSWILGIFWISFFFCTRHKFRKDSSEFSMIFVYFCSGLIYSFQSPSQDAENSVSKLTWLNPILPHDWIFFCILLLHILMKCFWCMDSLLRLFHSEQVEIFLLIPSHADFSNILYPDMFLMPFDLEFNKMCFWLKGDEWIKVLSCQRDSSFVHLFHCSTINESYLVEMCMVPDSDRRIVVFVTHESHLVVPTSNNAH